MLGPGQAHLALVFVEFTKSTDPALVASCGEGIKKCELGENQPRNETRVGGQLEAAKHKSRVTHPALLTQCGPNY